MLTLTPAARRLEPADLAWATNLMMAATAAHPALPFLGAGAGGGGARRWLLAQLLRYVLRCGRVYANADDNALALWLTDGPAGATAPRLLRAGVLTGALWHLGWAGTLRLWRWLQATDWLRRHSLDEPHHYLLALVVHPEHRGAGAGRRLLLATLAALRIYQLPCYADTQAPAALSFFQRLGFRVVGHCALGGGGAPTNWGLVRRINH